MRLLWVRVGILLSFYLVFIHGLRSELEWPDSKFGESTNSTTVENMRPWRIGNCQVRMGADDDKKEDQSNGAFACTPDFMFIGSSKAGTSSISSYLQSHPLIRNINQNSERSNEAHLFDKIQKKSLQKIMKYIYEVQPPINDLENRNLVMEYTPNYLVVDTVPSLIKLAFPTTWNKLKFLVCLREPVARTVSSWKAKKTGHPEFPSFANVVAQGMKMGRCIEDCWNRGYFDKPPITYKTIDEFMSRNDSYCTITYCREQHDTSNGFAGGRSSLAHIVKSMYFYELLVWWKHFDRKQFHVFTLEEYMKNPIRTFEKILDFLGLPLYDSSGKYGFRNRAEVVAMLRKVRNSTPHVTIVENEVTPEIKQKLNAFFKPFNKHLVEKLGLDFGFPV